MTQRIAVRTRHNDALGMALTLSVGMALMLSSIGRASLRDPVVLLMFVPLIIGCFSQSVSLRRVCFFLWVGIASGVVVLSSFR